MEQLYLYKRLNRLYMVDIDWPALAIIYCGALGGDRVSQNVPGIFKIMKRPE